MLFYSVKISHLREIYPKEISTIELRPHRAQKCVSMCTSQHLMPCLPGSPHRIYPSPPPMKSPPPMYSVNWPGSENSQSCCDQTCDRFCKRTLSSCFAFSLLIPGCDQPHSFHEHSPWVVPSSLQPPMKDNTVNDHLRWSLTSDIVTLPTNSSVNNPTGVLKK